MQLLAFAGSSHTPNPAFPYKLEKFVLYVFSCPLQCTFLPSTPMTNHVPIAVLWACSRDPSFLVLESEHMEHLTTCEECVAIIWLSRSAESFEQLKDQLRERGYRTD